MHRKLLSLFTEMCVKASCRQTYALENLRLSVFSDQKALGDWTTSYLYPLFENQERLTPQREFDVFAGYSDEVVQAAIEAGSTGQVVRGYENIALRRTGLSDGLVLFVEPQNGMAWLADCDSQRLLICYSSRTRWPALEVARAVREVVALYLESVGWEQYHAGGVAIGGSVMLLPGPKRVGKTTLVLSLVGGGASYVSNDRAWLKQEGERVRVLGYPMVIAVGLGAALQFPPIARLLRCPDFLMYPRRRFDVVAAAGATTDELMARADKIDIMPAELETLLQSPRSTHGGDLSTILLPNVQREAVPTSLRPMSAVETTASLSLSCFRDPDYPRWLDFGWGSSARGLDGIPIKAFEVTFSAQRFSDVLPEVVRALKET